MSNTVDIDPINAEQRILELCAQNPEGINDIIIQHGMPQVTAQQRLAALNRLLSKQKLISFQILVSSFAAKILVASMALILFLLFMSDASSFEMLTQTQRIINLLFVLLASMAIYFGSSSLLGIKAKDFK